MPAGLKLVGLGGSAGSLEAFGRVLGELSPEAPLAVLLAQHVSPDAEGLLTELLGRRTKLRVVQARDGMTPEAGTVYVIPPGTSMRLAEGRLAVDDRDANASSSGVIDALLQSMADELGGRAAAAIVSGNADDGSNGVRAVHEAGGLTMAQSPAEAKFEGMPANAIATEAVDYVGTAEELGRRLMRFAGRPKPAGAATGQGRKKDAAQAPEETPAGSQTNGEAGGGPGGEPGGKSRGGPGEGSDADGLRPSGRFPPAGQRLRAPQAEPDEAGITEEQLQQVFGILRKAVGVDFTYYKPPTIRRRLRRRMSVCRIEGVAEYIRLCQNEPGEAQRLYQDLLIHVTRFFREPESFEVLKREVFPEIMAGRRDPERAVRIWIPGCSTGEEAYSVAIAILEYFEANDSARPVQIFATDISDSAVEHARNGAYGDRIVDDLTPDRLRRFFSNVDGQYRIAKAARDMVIFARQDLTRDPPFSRLDLVLCRNVMIYLGPVLQKKLMGIFHYAINPDGFLMLGSAETTATLPEAFELRERRHRLYRRRGDGRPKHPASTYQGPSQPVKVDRESRPQERQPLDSLEQMADRLVLEQFTPAGVVVNHQLSIVQFRGRSGRYLEPAPGGASLSLLKMARDGLLHGLRAALGEAKESGKPARRDGLQVRYNGHILGVSVVVCPLNTPNDPQHFLILFEETEPPVAVADINRLSDERRSHKPARQPHDPNAGTGPSPEAENTPGRGEPAAQETDDEPAGVSGAAGAKAHQLARIRHLEQELAASRDYLQAIIQDLEGANEELQSANEEVLSSNEELQSTNEELHTLNEELHGRNDELSRVNSDLVNLLASVHIAIVIVSADLKIRRFTPMAESVMNLIPGDVGRPLNQINPKIVCPNLDEIVAKVIDSVDPVELEVQDRQGRWFALRVRPYKNVENKIDGAVLALIDIDRGRKHELQLQRERNFNAAVLETVTTPLLVLDGEMVIRRATRPFCEMFSTSPQQAEGGRLFDLGRGEWDLPELRTLLSKVITGGSGTGSFVVEQEIKDGPSRPMKVEARRITGDEDRQTLILLAIRPLD